MTSEDNACDFGCPLPECKKPPGAWRRKFCTSQHPRDSENWNRPADTKPVIVLRRYLHQLPKELKKPLTKIKQAVLQKGNFSLLPLAIFFSTEGSACGYREAVEYTHRGNGRALGLLTKLVEKLKIKFSCVLRATTGIVRAIRLQCEEGSGDAVGTGAVAWQSLLTHVLG